MKLYRVTWFIDLEAETPKAAAGLAREIQLDPENEATVFEVTALNEDGTPAPGCCITEVDLLADDRAEIAPPDGPPEGGRK